MAKAKWMGISLVILVLFWSCATLSETTQQPEETNPVVEIDPTPITVGTTPHPTHEELVLAAQASIEGIEERMRQTAQAQPEGVAVIHASPQTRHHLTAVQAAPSYFSGFAFSELPRERRRQALAFNRQWSEAHLIHDLGGPNAESLYNATLLVLSRAIVHEANFMHRPCGSGPGQFHTACDTLLDRNHAEFDGPAMYAVFRATRSTGMTLLGSIRNHMNYATEELPPVRDRSRWIVELTLEGTRPPHFQATDSEGNPLNWDRDYLPRWLQVVEMSRRLLNGHDLGSCAIAPLVTWGGRCEDVHGACDDNLGSHRGLVGMSCGDSSNRFWCRPGTRGCVETDPIPHTPEIASEETTVPTTSTESVEVPVTEPEPEPVAEAAPPEDGPLAMVP